MWYSVENRRNGPLPSNFGAFLLSHLFGIEEIHVRNSGKGTLRPLLGWSYTQALNFGQITLIPLVCTDTV